MLVKSGAGLLLVVTLFLHSAGGAELNWYIPAEVNMELFGECAQGFPSYSHTGCSSPLVVLPHKVYL